MKKFILSNSFLLVIVLISNNIACAQCRSYIKVDGNLIPVDPTSTNIGLPLPIWLSAGETLAADQNVNQISVIEYTVSGTTLTFSKVFPLTTLQTVPASSVWKVESILEKPSGPSSGGSIVYNNAGTYTFTVPACVSYLCVSVWGGGGGGGGSSFNLGAGGGGGGGYAQGCYAVSAGSTCNIIVGAGGTAGGIGGGTSPGNTGGTSSVSGAVSISATGGNGGNGGGNSGGSSGVGGSGGAGSGGTVNATGGTGGTTTTNSAGGAGGNGANGGSGAPISNGPGAVGTVPGGGGSGTNNGGYTAGGGVGAAGQVTISW